MDGLLVNHKPLPEAIKTLVPIATGLLRPIRVLMVGDSMTDHAAGRTAFYNAALAASGLIRLVGPFNTFSGSPSDYTLADGHHDGVSGAKIEHHLNGAAVPAVTAIQTVVATYTPDVVLVQLGTNNIGSGESSATVIARMQALIMAIMGAGIAKGNILISTIPPYLADATYDRQRILFNAELRALRDSMGVHIYDGGGSLVSSDIDVDNIHPTTAGYAVLGARWALGFAAFFGRSPGARLLIPRAFATHAAQSCLKFTANNDVVAIANHAGVQIPSAGSFVQAFWLYPDSLPAGSNSITCYGAWDAGWLTLQSGATGIFNIYANSNANQIGQAGRLAATAWHRVVQVADASAGTITQYVNGTTRLPATTTWAFATGGNWVIGKGTFNCGRFRLCDWTICHAGGSGFRVPTTEDIWTDYYDSTPGNPTLPGVAAYYPMHDGAGATVADYMGGAAGNITGATWEAMTMEGG